MPCELNARLSKIADEVQLDLANRQIDQLATYLHVLTRWNRTINLTALPLGNGEDMPDASLDRLVAEPLRAVAVLRAVVPAIGDTTFSWIDVGSGSGSPAIPMKVCLPRLTLTMVESRGRKAAFLREAARSAGVEVRVFAGRFEAFPGDGRASLVSVRAVRITRELSDAISGVLNQGGFVLSIGAEEATALFGYETVAASRGITVFQKCST